MHAANVTQLFQRIRTNGAKEASRRAARRVARSLNDKFNTQELDFPLFQNDIADSTILRLNSATGIKPPGKSFELAWLCTPPGPGSGGHTTLFRMVRALEARGHQCSLLLYNRHGSDMARAETIIREHWPWLQARVAPVPNVIDGYDACVASSWETAHVLARRSAAAAMHRFYFIQDYEPFFYPRGSLYSLAEDSYRFGFKNIALGNMVTGALHDNVGTSAFTVPFGCDGGTYSIQNFGSRHGVVFYARETADRRGTLLAKLALEKFHERHPEETIHVYGDPLHSWRVPHHHHGKLAAAQLSLLYNKTLAGLALSFTNISLVAEEMLSCGTIPVVNDHAFARQDLSASAVRWATPTPAGIAQALCDTVENWATPSEARLAASQARKNWHLAQAATTSIIETEVASE